MMKLTTAAAVTVMTLTSLAAQAEDASCSTVKMADPGWSDIAATNAITSTVLEGLGYKPKVDTLAVPIAYGGLKDG
ncbi:glycine/betaine ABC transporter substrate-binding protein, partial [Pseudomonas coronafaciens]